MKKLFHMHTWREVTRRFNPPPSNMGAVKYSGPVGSLERLMYGFTTLELRCSFCGFVKSSEIKGDARNVSTAPNGTPAFDAVPASTENK